MLDIILALSFCGILSGYAINKLKNDLSETKDKLSFTRKQLILLEEEKSKLLKEITMLKAEVQQKRTQRLDLFKRLTDLSTEVNDTYVELTGITQTNISIQDKMKEIKQYINNQKDDLR